MDLQKEFVHAVAAACRDTNISHGRLIRERSLDEVQDILFAVDSDPRDIAVRALCELYENEGQLDGVVCLAVVRFLDRTCGQRSTGVMLATKLTDLKNILAPDTKIPQIRECIQSWYP